MMDNPQTSDKDVESNVKQKVDLDSILVNEIGEFGKFQLKTLCLAVVIAIFAAWGATEFVFTTARIPTRCVIPECDGTEPEWSPYWWPNALPASGSSFDNCQRFGNTTTLLRTVESDTCPARLFDRDTLQPCDDFVFENTHSVAYDFDLACDEWRRSLIGTVRTFGTLTALPITGFISDRWGRRVALTINAFNTAWLGLIRYWANSYLVFMLSEFVEATFGSGGFSSVYILLMEVMGPSIRVAAGAAMNTSFAVGQVLMGLIAWGVPNWRYLTLTLYAPMLITVAYYWLITESIRWYMSKGRFDESEALLKKVAKANGRTISDKSLEALRQNAEEDVKKAELEQKTKGEEPWLIVQVFRHKRILLRCAISPVWWITTTFIYYGLSINAVNMSGNRYLNFVAVAAVEIPGYWTAVFLLGKIGRKPVLIIAFWICAACQIAYVFLPPDQYAASLTVYLVAKYSIATVMTSIYVYTAELYPTRHRHSLFAFSSMMGRIGSMLAPLTPAIGAQWFDELPFVLFACFALLSGALIFLTPETLGTTHSASYDFGLACNEWSRSMLGTVKTVGSLVNLPFTGYISDRWGRRVALTLNTFNSGVLGLSRYWSNSYISFAMLEFFEAVFGAGGFTSIYILLTELMGPKYRVAAGASMNSCFALGQIIIGLIAWNVPNWRNLTLILFIPQLLTVCYLWLMPESIRWYLINGRFDKSDASLKRIAKINEKTLSDRSLQALRDTAEAEAKNKELELKRSENEPWLIVQVFRHKRILLRCFLTPIWWITVTLVYYGLSINAVNISGNKYFNFIAVAAADIPGHWTSVYLIGKIGRKPVLIGAFWLCTACQVAYIFMPDGIYAASLTIYLIGKSSIAVAVVAISMYTAELYPTKYRHSLFAFSSMVGRIGSIIAPLTPAIAAQWFKELPFVLFGSFAFISGALIFLTPETLGAALPDTFEQAARIGLTEKKVNE